MDANSRHGGPPGWVWWLIGIGVLGMCSVGGLIVWMVVYPMVVFRRSVVKQTARPLTPPVLVLSHGVKQGEVLKAGDVKPVGIPDVVLKNMTGYYTPEMEAEVMGHPVARDMKADELLLESSLERGAPGS